VFTLLTQVFRGVVLKTLSSEGFRNLLSEFVQLVLDYKREIVRDDPTRYTRLVNLVVQTFSTPVRINEWGSYLNWNLTGGVIPRCALYYLPDELNDEFIKEAIVKPSGLKPLNSALAQQAATIPLSRALLIRSPKRLALVIHHGKEKAVTDEFGFLRTFSLNFPALPSEASGKAEPFTRSIHAFERAIIKKRLLQHADVTVSQSAIILHEHFVLKLEQIRHILIHFTVLFIDYFMLQNVLFCLTVRLWQHHLFLWCLTDCSVNFHQHFN
jgi:hypothetical protein